MLQSILALNNVTVSGVTASHGRITSGEGITSRQNIYKQTLIRIDERRRLSDERIDESAWEARKLPPREASGWRHRSFTQVWKTI